MLAHSRRGGVDYQMGGVLVAGGLIGTLIGAGLFSLLQRLGQIDVVINLLYVLLLGGIGSIMARESWQTLRAQKSGVAVAARKRRRRAAGRGAGHFEWRERCGCFWRRCGCCVGGG